MDNPGVNPHPGFAWNFNDPRTAKAIREVALNMARPPGSPPITVYLEDHPPEHRWALSDAMRAWLRRRAKEHP